MLAHHKLYSINHDVIAKGLPHLPGSILDGSGLKHIESIQTSLGNGLQLLPGIGLEYHPPV